MARHKSAQKRARQDAKRREHNRAIRSRTRAVVKELRGEIASGGATVDQQLRDAESALRKAASKGVVPKNRASRLVSRLHKAAQRAKQK